MYCERASLIPSKENGKKEAPTAQSQLNLIDALIPLLLLIDEVNQHFEMKQKLVIHILSFMLSTETNEDIANRTFGERAQRVSARNSRDLLIVLLLFDLQAACESRL